MSFPNVSVPCPQVPMSNHHDAKSFQCTSTFNHASQDFHLQSKNTDNLTQATPQPASRVNEEKQSPIQTNQQNPDISIVEKRILELEKNRYKLEKELLKGELRRRDELKKYRKMFAQSNENKNQFQQVESNENQVNQMRQSQQFVNKEIFLTDLDFKNSRGNSFDGQVYNKQQQTPAGSNFRSQNEILTANNAVYELPFLPQNLFNQKAVQKEQSTIGDNHQNLEFQQNVDYKKLQQVNDQIERQNAHLIANNFFVPNQRMQLYSNSKKYQIEEFPAFSSNQFITANQSFHDEIIQPYQFIPRNLDHIRLPLSESVTEQMPRNEILFDNQRRLVAANNAYQNSQHNSNFEIPFQNLQQQQVNEAYILENLKKQRELYSKQQNLQNKEIQLSSGYSIKSSITDQEYGNDYLKIVTEPTKIIQPFSSQERARVKRGSQSPQKNHNFNYKATQFHNQYAYQQPNFQNNYIQQQDSALKALQDYNFQNLRNQEIENKNQFQNIQDNQKYQMNIIENSLLNSSKNGENQQIQYINQHPKMQNVDQNQILFPYQNQIHNSSAYELKERTTPNINQQQFLEFNQNKNIFQSFDNVVSPSNGFAKEQDLNSQIYSQLSKPVLSVSSSIMNNDNQLKANQHIFETGNNFQIFDQSKDQGYFQQNRHFQSQQPTDLNIFKSQNFQNHDQFVPLDQNAQILSETRQNQSNFSLNNKSQSYDFDQRNEVINQNQKSYFENNETFNGSKQILPVSNYQSQNFDFVINAQNNQDSINQREPFVEKNDQNKKILNISHVNSIQIIPENNELNNLEMKQTLVSNKQDEQFLEENNNQQSCDSAQKNQEMDTIILPKFKMKELRSRSKDIQNINQNSEYQKNNKVIEKQQSRERFRENDSQPLKVLTVKLVNEKNRSHRGRHQKNQKHSPKSKSRINLNRDENIHQRAQNFQKYLVQSSDSPKSEINSKKFQDNIKQSNNIDQASNNLYMLKVNQNENTFLQNESFKNERMNKNDKNSNKENQKNLINKIEQLQLNTMTEGQLPSSLKFEVQRINSIANIQRNNCQSHQFFENLPQQLDEIKNLLTNIPENIQIQKNSKEIEDLQNKYQEKNKLENFQYFGVLQSANLPQKKRNIFINQLSENSNDQSKVNQFDNKLSTSEEIPLREQKQDESNKEINQIIIQSLQNLENCMKQIQQQDLNKKSVQSKDLQISREVVIEIPAQTQSSVQNQSISGNKNDDQLSNNKDSFQNLNNMQQNQFIIQNQQSFKNINEENFDAQSNQLNSQIHENQNSNNNLNIQANLNYAQQNQHLQNSSCKSTYTKDKFQNNLIDYQICDSVQKNNQLNHRSIQESFEQEQNLENKILQNSNRNQGYNETLKNSNFTNILCDNPSQSNKNLLETNDQNNEIEGLLNYVFQPQSNICEEITEKKCVRQSFGDTQKNESSSFKKEQNDRTVTISEVVDCNVQNVNYENAFQNDFNPFSSNNNELHNSLSKNSQKYDAQSQKQQDYVILNQMQNSYKIVNLKSDPSLQSNLIAKKSFDDSQNNVLIQSSSNQKSVNKQTFNENNYKEMQNEVQNQNIEQLKKSSQSIKSQQDFTQISEKISRCENFQQQSSQTSSQQRHLLQLDGNHNYHRADNKFADSSIQVFNQKIKNDNMRYNHENQSELMNSRKSNSLSKRSQSRKSNKQSNHGTLQSDIQNNQTQLQLDKNQINNNLMQQIQNLQANIELPNRLDPERKQFYREHFQAKNTLSQNSSGEKNEQYNHAQIQKQMKPQNGKPKNRRKSPKTELLRGYNKRIALQEESQNGLIELDGSSIQPKSLYDSTAGEHHNFQTQNQKFEIEKNNVFHQHQNNIQTVRVSASTSQPFKKKIKHNQNSFEKEIDIQKQETSPQYPPQYSFNHLPDKKINTVHEPQKKLTTPKRSPDMSNKRIEWQDTLMKVPQNNDISQQIQKINGNPWSQNMYIPHPFLPQQYSQPVFFAPFQNPYPQIQQPLYFGYENKNINIQNHNIPTVINTHPKNSHSYSQEKRNKIIQTDDLQKRQKELNSSQNNKPFRTVLNMQSQKLQQSYQILQNEFEKKREEEKHQNYNQAQRKLIFQDNERYLNDSDNNQVISYEQNKNVSQHSLDQSQSLNLSDGLEIQEVVPVQRNYKRSIQNDQVSLPFGHSQTISSYYKRETINNSQSNQNQLSNSSLLHNTNNPGFQKDLFLEKANSRNVNDSNQNYMNQADENQLSGLQSHQTSQSFIKSVSLKGHILAAKSPKFCNSITFDNQVHQLSSQIDSQHIQIPNCSLQFSQNKEDNQISSSKKSSAQEMKNISQNLYQRYNQYIEDQRDYQQQNIKQKDHYDIQSPLPSIMISHLQSLQMNNQSSVASPNSNQLTPITIQNNMNSIINKEKNYQMHSHKDTLHSDINKQENRNPTSEYDKSISKKQQSHLTMQQESTPGGYNSQYAGDSKSATVDQRDQRNIQQNSSILIKRLSSFKSDYSEVIDSNQQILNISRESQNTKNQQKSVNSALRYNSQRETGLKIGNNNVADNNIHQKVKNQLIGSSFNPQNKKNISKDFKKDCENDLDPELTPITNNMSNQNFFKQNLNSDFENENHQKSIVSDDCRDMILEFKRTKNNNVILNMEKNMKELQERIQSKIERQGSKNSQSTNNLPQKSQINQISLQNNSQINYSENVLRPNENHLIQKTQDNYKFKIDEKIFQQTSQTTLNSCHKNSQLDYQIHQKQLSKYSDPITQKFTQQRSSQVLASNKSSYKDITISNNANIKDNEQIQSIEDFKQDSEKSFQKLSDLPSCNSLKQIQNASLDQPLFSKRYRPKEFKSIYSGKEDQNELYGYYKSSSNLQNSESYNDEVENHISRSLLEVQVKEFLQQPNIAQKLKIVGDLDLIKNCDQKLRNTKINIESGSNSQPVYSHSGYEQAVGGFLMQTGEEFEESYRDSKSQSRVSMGKLLESNKTIIREMREQNSKESSRQFLKSEHFQ